MFYNSYRSKQRGFEVMGDITRTKLMSDTSGQPYKRVFRLNFFKHLNISLKFQIS
jgi:hypothetical protein